MNLDTDGLYCTLISMSKVVETKFLFPTTYLPSVEN